MTPIRDIMKIRPADIEPGENGFQNCLGSSEMEQVALALLCSWQRIGNFAPVPVCEIEGGRSGKGIQFLEMRGLLKVVGERVYPTRELVILLLKARPSESGRLKLILLEGGQPIQQLLPGTWVQGEVHPHYDIYP